MTFARLRAALGLAALMVGMGVWPLSAQAGNEPNWTRGIEAGLPSDAASDPQVDLNSVSCASAGNCVAVGTYLDTSSNVQGLIVSESSGVWSTGVKPPLPAGAGTTVQNVVLSTISCPSVGNCAAAGYYLDASGNDQGLLLSESGGTWTATELQAPAGASPNPGVNMSSVSCPSAGNCGAVGSYSDSTGNQAVVVNESSGTWGAGQKANLPANARTAPYASLTSVSCASAGNCTAVGGYEDNTGQSQGLLLGESSGSWSVGVEATPPADVNTTIGTVEVRSVSCPSAGNCLAVGQYYSSGNYYKGLLLSEASGVWATGLAPSLPANANTDTSPYADVSSVACPSLGNCTATGGYDDTNAQRQGLLLNESGGTWSTGQEATLPAGADATQYVSLNALSCPSAGNCVSVGFYNDASGYRAGLLLSETSGVWSQGIQAALPAAAPSSPEAFLNAVSCPSIRACAAVGYFDDSTTGMNDQGLIVSAVAATPSLALTAPGAGLVNAPVSPSSVTATLGSGVSPSGRISFRVFGPQTSPPTSCASGGSSLGSTAVSGNAAYHTGTGYTPKQAGDYWWYASYSGDTGDNPQASRCGPSMPETVVAPATPALDHLRLSPTRFRAAHSGPSAISASSHRGTLVTYQLNEAATVRFTVARGKAGSTKFVPMSGSFKRKGVPGKNRFRFTGRIKGSRLRPGRYELLARPTANGHLGRRTRTRFWILKG